MLIDILCPLYNASNDFETLISGINKQTNITINKIIFPVTESADNTLELARSVPNAIVIEVLKKDFSHSLTREMAMEYAESDVVIFMTQDVCLENENALFELAKCIEGDVIHAFARQVTKYKGIERYTREKNYPKESYIVSKDDIEDLQIKAFFSSDACAAYSRSKFLELKGFDGKRFEVSEDMYYCRKILLNGYRFKYCAESVVFHSHKFTLKQLYKRYYNMGKFFYENPIFNQYKSNGSGLSLAFYVLRRAICRFDIPTLFRWFPDMCVRYIATKKGKKNG